MVSRTVWFIDDVEYNKTFLNAVLFPHEATFYANREVGT